MSSRDPDPSGLTRGKRLVFILVIQLAVVAFIAVALEVGLWLDSLRFPFNGVSGGERLTWGQPVELNRAGFREREFAPKAPGTWRILVLGDSITWGVGLARSERYTELIERALTKQFPDRDIEVLNLGKPGLSTVGEAEILQRWIEPLQPDQLLVGFGMNDPVVGSAFDSVERSRVEWVFDSLHVLRNLGLIRLWSFLDLRVHQLLIRFGLIPSGLEVHERAYLPDSPAWRSFVAALQRISRLSNERELVPPFLAILRSNAFSAQLIPGDPRFHGYERRRRLYRQAKSTAQSVGFRVVDYGEEAAREFTADDIVINSRDGHPSAAMNRLYARKLVPRLSRAIVATQARVSKRMGNDP